MLFLFNSFGVTIGWATHVISAKVIVYFCQQPSSTDNLGDMKQTDLNCVGTNFVAFVSRY